MYHAACDSFSFAADFSVLDFSYVHSYEFCKVFAFSELRDSYLTNIFDFLFQLVPDVGGDDEGDARLPVDKVRGVIPLHDKVAHVSDELKVVSEYLQATIPLFTFVFFFPEASNADIPFWICQLLSQKWLQCKRTQPKRNMVKSFGMFNPLKFYFGTDYKGTPLPATFDTFKTFEPTHIDILGLLRSPVEDVANIRIWSTRLSDFDGCSQWHTPQPLKYTGSLVSPSAPTLAVIDKLREDGYIAVARKVKHQRRCGKYYDHRGDFYGNKFYLQCALVQGSLFDRGLTKFESGKVNAYYQLLLKDPRDSHATLRADQCKLKMIVDGAACLPVAYVPRVRAAIPDGIDGDSDDDVTLADILKRLAPIWEPPPLCDDDAVVEPDAAELASSSSSSYDSAGPPHPDHPPLNDIDGDDDDDLERYPDEIEGCKLGVPESHDGKTDIGFRVKYPRHGAECRMFRSVHLDVEYFGILAAPYFIGCWAKAAAHMSLDEHRKFKPSKAQVRAYIASRG